MESAVCFEKSRVGAAVHHRRKISSDTPINPNLWWLAVDDQAALSKLVGMTHSADTVRKAQKHVSL